MRKFLTAAALISVDFVLAGCAGSSEAVPTPAPTLATPEPVVETAPELTDEEALEIAVSTYEEYLAISGELLASGGENFADLEEITTPNMNDLNEQALEEARSNEFDTEGHIPVVKGHLLRHDEKVIEALLCIDLSQSRLYLGDGTPVGDPGQRGTNAIDARISIVDDQFKVDRSDAWSQSDFCSE